MMAARRTVFELRALAALAASLAALVAGCRDPASPDGCTPNPCPDGTECDPASGACAPVSCTPGLTRCAPAEQGALERCSSTGDAWVRVGACGPGQACVAGSAPGEDGCSPAACTRGSTTCEADGRVRYCIAGAFEDPVACAAGEVCDAATSSACAPTVCTPSARFCTQSVAAVRECNALGTGSTFVETCGPAEWCVEGTCFGPCDLGGLYGSFDGCVYYPLDTDNVSRDDPLQFDVVVSNPSPTYAADVVVEARSGPGGAWEAVTTGTVASGATETFALPDRHAEGTALAPALAYRLTASVPVVAYQINSDDLAAAAASSGATLLLVRNALGEDHRVITLPTSTGSDALFDFGAEIHGGGFAVVATEDGTDVTVTPSAPTPAAPGIPALAAGDTWTTTLEEGDVLQMTGAGLGDDLTGTRVVSTAPVAVFAYHACATIDPGTCDHFEEELLAVSWWSAGFAAGRFAASGTAQLWRVLAADDATTVTYEYAPGTTGFPGPSGSTFQLDANEWQDFYVAGPAPLPGEPAGGDFLLLANQPVLVAQFSTGEVAMALSPPVASQRGDFRLFAPPGFADSIAIAKWPTATATLDGATIPASAFSGLPSSWGFYRAGLAAGPHVLTSSAPTELEGPVAVWLSGAAGSAGIAWVAGLANKSYLPPAN